MQPAHRSQPQALGLAVLDAVRVFTYLSHSQPLPTGPILLRDPRFSVGPALGQQLDSWRLETNAQDVACLPYDEGIEGAVVADGTCESFAHPPTTHITSASGQWKSSEQARGADGLHGDDRARRLKAQRRCGGLAAPTIQRPPPICGPLQERLGKAKEGSRSKVRRRCPMGSRRAAAAIFTRSQPAGRFLLSLGLSAANSPTPSNTDGSPAG
jgi:hypothetical protein